MTATVHIVKGAARTGKTAQLLLRCRALAGPGKGPLLWLSPNRRRLDQLRASLANVPGLRLTTFADLSAELIAAAVDVRTLSRGQGRLLLDETVAELLSRKRLPHFGRVADTRGFLDNAAALVAELQQHAISPNDLRSVVPSEDDSAGKLRQCAAVLETYQKRLRDLHLVDADGKDSLARTHFLPEMHWQAVLIDDFSDFTTPQLDLLEELSRRAEEMWITLQDEEGEERGELFAPARRTEERLARLSPASGAYERPSVDKPERSYAPLAGLVHLERHLFRPLRQTPLSADAAGLLMLQAPGMVGEARMVARRIKSMLLDGVAAEEIIVAVRDLAPYADLLREVFEEYGIPVDVEGTEPLLRHPLVALLLKALRLPDDDWAFGEVTALLRSTFLKPDWPEARFDDNVPLLAEALLRLLGEPRGRDAYLSAVRRWATEKLPGLEDEQAEESRRQRTHELAQQCAPFLERFFGCWDTMPTSALVADHVAWMRVLVAELGLADDGLAWKRFWEEVQAWVERETQRGSRRRLDRRTFQRRLHGLALAAGLQRTPRGPGRVRILSAEIAACLNADHLFVLGLGERGFPLLAVPSPLLDETERQGVRQQGLDITCLSDVLSEEMLLFYGLVTRARQSLVLSYPAIDEKGQPLLPSSFLSAVLDLFEPGAVPTERRVMLIEGYDRDEPLSPAEQRVRVALAMVSSSPLPRFGGEGGKKCRP